MENLLIKYFEARIKAGDESQEPGPVITLSREYGCPSKILAQILVDKLNALDKNAPTHTGLWRWIGRELLEESARDLKIDPKHIGHIFDYQERSVIDDILAATRKDGSYKSDFAIRKSLSKVIHSLGHRGHIVIVGRAGVALTREIRKSLHVRLMAPLEWRVEALMRTEKLSKEKALELITTKDANRKRFLEYYLGQKFSMQIFDLVYNCAYLSLDEIADSIILLAGQRQFLKV